MLKLKHYDGTESLDTFLHKFQSMAAYLRCEEPDIKYHLCGSLEGAAGLVLADLALDATSEDVIKLLKTRFGTELQKERFRAELRRVDVATASNSSTSIKTLVAWSR